ncbi:MAG: MBL fold metallo-hydrolase [bacterium]
MKLKVLVDNNTITDKYFCGEPGVSYLIEDEGKKILFDLGYSDTFIKNANKLDEDLQDLDFVVVSHGHLDHTWGLKHLIEKFNEWETEKINFKKPTLVAHPLAFNYKELKGRCIGSLIEKKVLEKFFELKLTREPFWLTDNLVFLGEIERTNSFENIDALGDIFIDSRMRDDYLLDDSALAYKNDKGTFVITGCSHAGICNIIEYSKKITEKENILDVIGGFHLLNPEENLITETLEYFKGLTIEKAHPCHCVDLKSKIKISKVINIKEVGSGLIIEI